MVWKRLIAVAACLCICAVSAVQASAASVYDGTISTTYLTIFRDAVAALPIGDDYVFFRSGEYEYTLYSGDITYSGRSFTLNDGKAYTLTYQSSYGQNNYYHWNVSEGVTDSVTASDYLFYSSLGDYPRLEERGSVYAFASFFLLSVLSIGFVLRPLFSYILRARC